MRLGIAGGVLVIGAWFAALALAYGHTGACHALAVERARRSPVPTAIAQPLTRIETGAMSSRACVNALLWSWGERVAGALR